LLRAQENGNWEVLKNTLQRLNLSAVDYILIPINQNDVHWTLVSLSCNEKSLRFYDSLGGEGGEILKLIANFFSKITNTPYNEWQIEIMKNIPRQNNSYDCGVFVCQYAYCISKGVAFNFKQNDMINIRQIMKEELATGKLRERLLVVPSVPSPQMALFAPSPIPALPPATLLLPPSPIPAQPPATFSPPPTPIPAAATYIPASSNYCTAESYVS
jgi:sentrin-specific protease 1